MPTLLKNTENSSTIINASSRYLTDYRNAVIITCNPSNKSPKYISRVITRNGDISNAISHSMCTVYTIINVKSNISYPFLKNASLCITTPLAMILKHNSIKNITITGSSKYLLLDSVVTDSMNIASFSMITADINTLNNILLTMVLQATGINTDRYTTHLRNPSNGCPSLYFYNSYRIRSTPCKSTNTI